MKKSFHQNPAVGRVAALAALIAAGFLAAVSASADTITNAIQNFDAAFGPSQSFAFTYNGGDSIYSAVSVVAGAGLGGTSAAEQTNATQNLNNGYAYAGFAYQETAMTGNTGTSLSQYTLSFDARCSVPNGNSMQVKIQTPGGGLLDTAPANPGYGNDMQITTNYVHYSLNLADATVFKNFSTFVPTAGTWTFVFQNNSGRGANPPAWTMDIDNLMVTMTTIAPPPTPVSIVPPVKVAQGLNEYATTENNAFYDRQEVVLQQATNLSWVGHATVGNPVSYSFTVAGAPPSANAQAQLMLVPNFGKENSPDWNAPNCVVVWLSGSPTQAVMNFAYKVNEPAGNAMTLGNAPYTQAPGSWDGVTAGYQESGRLGSVTNTAGMLGTWTVTFTSDTNITLFAPNGSSSSIIMPPYNVGNFGETTSFNVYLGMQPQNAAAMNHAFTYSAFAATGVATPVSDNFLADSTLNTNIWDKSVATAPNAIFVSPGSQQMVAWTLPANGFGLQSAGSLANGTVWNDLTQGPILPMIGMNGQVVSSSELAPGDANFFRLLKRTYTQLQVLLPGQTNAPGTVLGYVGTPTPVSLAAQGLNGTPVTVNACDATWHIIGGVTDLIHVTTSDSAAYLPTDQAMVNGTATFTSANPLIFQTAGSQTVTAHDNTSLTVTNSATSASVTVGP